MAALIVHSLALTEYQSGQMKANFELHFSTSTTDCVSFNL